MREYLDLYEAIWEKILPAYAGITTKLLYNRGFDSAYKLFILNRPNEHIEEGDKRFKFQFLIGIEYCKIRTREIERRIRELVYNESQEWPHNKNYKIRDEEYNSKLAELKTEVAEYARERMSKRWRNL